MNDIQSRLKEAQTLNESIQKTEAFLLIAHRAQEVDEKNSKQNELNGVNRFCSCHIAAYISTGSQSPRYECGLIDNDVIMGLMTGGLKGVEEKLQSQKKKLNVLLGVKQ